MPDLRPLRDITHALTGDRDSHSVLRTLCDAASREGNTDGAVVAQISAESGIFVVGTGLGAQLVGMPFPATDSVTQQAARERRPIAFHATEQRQAFFKDLLHRLDVGPILVLPLYAGDELLGVLSVMRRNGGDSFADGDIERLGTVVDLAALALWKTRLTEEAERANREKTTILATLSHELRNPLSALEGYGELLDDGVLGALTPQQHDVIVRLRTVGRHLGAMIEDILTYASLEGDRVAVRIARVELATMLAAIETMVEPSARAKSLTLRTEPACPEASIDTDEARLRQILLNLCLNAVKFTELGEVVLRVECADSQVRFIVRDTGIGIDPAQQQRLFRPFSQLEQGSARRQKGSGTGLGLYISRRLAELLGGRIDMRSTPGDGSTFTLILPH